MFKLHLNNEILLLDRYWLNCNLQLSLQRYLKESPKAELAENQNLLIRDRNKL